MRGVDVMRQNQRIRRLAKRGVPQPDIAAGEALTLYEVRLIVATADTHPAARVGGARVDEPETYRRAQVYADHVARLMAGRPWSVIPEAETDGWPGLPWEAVRASSAGGGAAGKAVCLTRKGDGRCRN
ncbi:MAG TPA: hypothetical protein VMW52_00900 [Phycisphaerae bacterium]|nr:hypothetical protein [Phycisphaerae bacterium]